MRLSVVLVLALAALAAAGPHGGEDGAARDRPRRFLLGWDVADNFFHRVAVEVRRAWSESASWARHLFSWARRHPEHSTVYRVRLPHGSGVVAIIESRGPGGRRHHHRALVWDGRHLTAQAAGHGSRGGSSDAALNISVLHAGVNHTVPLSAFAKYLSHVPAGSKIHVDIRGSSWSNLRIVLRVVGQHGEDQQKSVSVLLSTVLKEIEQASQASQTTSKKSASKEKSSFEKSDKSSKRSSKKSSKKSSKESSEKSSKKSSSSSSSSSLRWDGHDLVWADVGSGKHVRRRLRVTQDGVSQVIPFSVLALHLKGVPANSDISFEVTGHTLKDLRVLLHVHGAQKQTVSLLVSKLIAETEASKHSGSAKRGAVRARVEGKKEGKKVTENVPVSAQQV